MYKDVKNSLTELSEDAMHTYKKAKKHAPRMKKEITVSSKYFSDSSSHACAESLIRLNVDCNLLKLALLLLAGMLILSIYCRIRFKKR